MGTVLEKANKIKETKNKLKEAINDGGGQITNNTVFNNYADEIKNIYIDAINDGVDNLYNNFPKIIGDGSEIILDTEEAPMKITLEGNTNQKTSILPEGYTQVDYIEGTGTQYLDTGLILTQDNSIELEISMNEKNTKNKMIFGSRSNASSNNISINATETIVADFNNSAYSTYRVFNSFDIDTKYIIYNSKEKRVIYDENRNILSQETDECIDTITTPNTATLFYINPKPSNTWYNASAKIYYCKIWDNDTLIRDIIPCYRNSDNVVGMYDLITDIFYTNQGTDVFTYGNVVQIPNPDYPQNIKVVTGEQNITVQSKNLCDLSQGYRRGYINANGGAFKAENVSYILNQYIKVVGGNTYTYSTNQLINNMSIFSYNENKEFIKREIITYNKSKCTITVDSNAKYILLGGNYNNSSIITQAILNGLDIQLENGSTATTYTPYQLQTYSLSLDNIELARINNYKDYIFKNEVDSPYYNTDLDLNEWYLHKEFNKYYLEDLTFQLSGKRQLSTTQINEILKPAGNGNTIPLLCSHYINKTANSTYNGNQGISISQGKAIYIYDNNYNNVKSIGDYNTWIEINNPYFIAKLEIPTNTKITDTTLVSQLENINNNAKSYLGTTIIECSSVNDNNEAIQASTIALKNINLIESEWSL